jgi:nucleoside-diphosphate-sugar epimerase
MNVFLTGATGYIGSVVAKQLQQAGHTVVGLARSETAAAKLRERNIQPLVGDLRDVDKLVDAAQQADGVIHTAFFHDWGDFASAVKAERKAVAAMVQALEGSGKPLIAPSGTGVLGDTGDRIVNEDTPIDSTFIGAVRAEVEQEVIQAAQRNVRGVVLRLPFFVYGRGASVFPTLLLNDAQQSGSARYIGSGENKMSAVHVDDVARLFVLALEKAPAGSLFHAGVESGITMKAIAQAISRTVGCGTASISVEQATERWGVTAAALLSISSQTSASKAIQELGWQPQANVSLLEDIEQGSYRKWKANTNQDRYERGFAKLKEIDGEAGERVIESLKDIAPDFGRYVIEFPFGDIYSRPGLDLKSRQIATVAALTALGNAQPQLKIHTHAALNVGCTREEVVETMMQMAVYAGFPAALNGLFTAKAVFAERDEQGFRN